MILGIVIGAVVTLVVCAIAFLWFVSGMFKF